MAGEVASSRVGVVVIGRNEGERLRRCFGSLIDIDARVYVDSGSTDASCELAGTAGFGIVELDMTQPFSAARARNAGFDWLLARRPDLQFVQMIDGDCEMRAGWIVQALADHAADQRRAIVFGRRREREWRRNAFHLACDEEWNVPPGEAHSCGGDALVRVSAFRAVGGYNPSLIAGEEPDMCLRLRRGGWRIWSNGAEMTWHDVAIDRLTQWWSRAKRAGFAFAQLVDLHGPDADPTWRHLVRSALGWTLVALMGMAGAVGAMLFPSPWAAAAAAAPAFLIAVQIARMTASKLPRLGVRGAAGWACLIMIAKAAQVQGWLEYRHQLSTGRRAALIEYKS